MTSYVFSVINKKIKWDRVYDILDKKYGADFEILFAIRKNNPELEYLLKLQEKSQDFFVYSYENDKSENFMLSETIKKANGDDLILVRDYFEFATVLSDVLVGVGAKGIPLAMYRKPKKQNKFKDFFVNIYKKVVRFVFGFSLYEGDIGLMYFGNIAFSILKEMPNNILLTKINRWSGFDVSYIEMDDLTKPVFEKHAKKKLLTQISIFASLTLLSLGAFVTLLVLNLLGFIGGLLLVVSFLGFGLWLKYLIIKLSIIDTVGDLE